jgi:hypothetical protein
MPSSYQLCLWKQESFLVLKAFFRSLLELSKLYAGVNLFFAAKYYGLAAAFAFLNLPDERLRQIAYAACAQAASADYASGGSLLFFQTARLFVLITSEYSMGGSDERRREAWASIDFYALVLARASGLLYEKLHSFIVKAILPSLGLNEIYAESTPQLDVFFSKIQGLDALAAKAFSAGIAPAFSDVGPVRRAAWNQLGLNWHLEWETDYDTDRNANALASTLQILLADFAGIELSLIPGDVFVRVEVHDADLEIKQLPDNERVSRIVRLPRAGTDSKMPFPRIAEAVAGVLLKTVSALPNDKFMQRYEAQLERGLSNRLNVYRPGESLFEEFYARDDHDTIYAIARSSILQMPEHVIPTWTGLCGPQGTHPDYSKNESLAVVRKRYRKLPPLVRRTLPRLLADETVRRDLQLLKGEGWKDWHLLLAIENVRFNYWINSTPELREKINRGDKEALMKSRGVEEGDEDPVIPSEEFKIENLKQSLRVSQLSTLSGLGLGVSQQTPNLEGVDRLLRRFHYWDDDVPHPDIFSW